MEQSIKWLTQQEPWVKYRTKIDLLGYDQNEPEIIADFSEMAKDNLITGLLNDLTGWPGTVVKRHNDAKLLIHKLVFLIDLGFSAEHPVLLKAAEKILASQSADGPFQIIGNIPTAFGGSGKNEELWMLCDTPLLTYSLIKMGLGENEKITESVKYLLNLQQDFGWPCFASSTLGKKFKGPGKRADPCPYANLLMLKLLSSMPDKINSNETTKGIEVLLDLWEHRKEVKYYLFGMGTDFKKLKAPLIWFDILHVADVLSNFDKARKDKRFADMVDIIHAKADEQGRYKAESAYMAWKNWNFGQKKESSSWITFLICRILKRMKF
ncbi:MAG: hypothetical protein K9H26_09140 [Prolixibacteraceae bacterium]|nr:hypothetical protein [Prolixibacteraceae bacterium]